MANSIHDEHLMLQGLPSDVLFISEFMELPKAVQVLQKKSDFTYGLRYCYKGRTLGIEWFEGKNQNWIEDAAEDWVLSKGDIKP